MTEHERADAPSVKSITEALMQRKHGPALDPLGKYITTEDVEFLLNKYEETAKDLYRVLDALASISNLASTNSINHGSREWRLRRISDIAETLFEEFQAEGQEVNNG